MLFTTHTDFLSSTSFCFYFTLVSSSTYWQSPLLFSFNIPLTLFFPEEDFAFWHFFLNSWQEISFVPKAIILHSSWINESTLNISWLRGHCILVFGPYIFWWIFLELWTGKHKYDRTKTEVSSHVTLARQAVDILNQFRFFKVFLVVGKFSFFFLLHSSATFSESRLQTKMLKIYIASLGGDSQQWSLSDVFHCLSLPRKQW